MFENGWDEDELAAKLGRVLDLNGRRNGLESQLVGILADILAAEPDGSVRTVARALANRVLKDGLKVKTEDGQAPYEVLSEAFGWFLGVDVTYGWSAVEASVEGMESAITGWVEKVTALRGVWKSQAAAVTALVLHDASLGESKKAARAALVGA